MPTRPSALLLLALVPSIARAQDPRDAEVLPRGIGVAGVAVSLTPGAGRFGPTFSFLERESIVQDFQGLDLARTIAGGDSAKVRLENLIGGLGTLNLEASQTTVIFNLALAYGITDRFMVAAFLPIAHTDYTIEAWLTPTDIPANPATGRDAIRQSHYRVRDPEGFDCPNGTIRFDDPSYIFDNVIEDAGDAYQFNVGDLRRALTSKCLGYVLPFDETYVDAADGLIHGKGSRSYDGFRDAILAARYQYFENEWLRLAGTFYMLAPTGQPDDPHNPFDASNGDEQWDGAILANAGVRFGRFHASLSTGYEIQFGDHIVRRLLGLDFSDDLERQLARGEITEEQLYAEHLDEGTIQPIVPAYDTAEVSRKLGDNLYVYLTAGFSFTEYLGAGAGIDYRHHFRDTLSDTGARVSDGSRFPTSAEIRAGVDKDVAEGRLSAADKEQALVDRLPGSAERKAAAFAWHGLRDNFVLNLSVDFSTLEWFLKDEFPFPIIVGLRASIPIAGRNNDALDQFTFSVAVPFSLGGEPKKTASPVVEQREQ